MAKKLKRGESVPEGVRRLATERLQGALELIASGAPDGIHEVRKELKQLRALLRLVRSELGKKRYAAENARYRDIAKPLSAVRDSEVLVEAARKLSGAGALVRALEVRHRALLHQVLVEERQLERCAQALEEALEAVPTWPLERRGWKALEPNLKALYARCRRARAEAQRSGTDEALHAWRKQTKYLRAMLEVGAPAWPKVMRELDEGLRRLGDALGDDHDLAVLEGLIDRGELRLPSAMAARARASVQAHRRALQADAFKLGGKLLGREPGELMRALHTGWKSWRR
ncbi:MAG: CHAD domain-containing protein [Deltaproteobacteria bacterium]|nr:CHAD domain-containing protein [Deltaproteobacteria bacterium]